MLTERRHIWELYQINIINTNHDDDHVELINKKDVIIKSIYKCMKVYQVLRYLSALLTLYILISSVIDQQYAKVSQVKLDR